MSREIPRQSPLIVVVLRNIVAAWRWFTAQPVLVQVLSIAVLSLVLNHNSLVNAHNSLLERTRKLEQRLRNLDGHD